MIPLSRVQKTSREWLQCRILPEYPSIYHFVTGKERFESLTTRIHAMINRVIHTPIKAGPDKTVVMEFKSDEAIDAYIIRCLMTYCSIWKKTFDADGPIAATSTESPVIRSKKDPVAMANDEGDAEPVRLESGSA